MKDILGAISHIIVNLQKAFDTVDHEILLSKLDYYGICGVSNNQFDSRLHNHKTVVSINSFDFRLTEINCEVFQGSILGPGFYFDLFYFYHVNELNQAIKIL